MHTARLLPWSTAWQHCWSDRTRGIFPFGAERLSVGQLSGVQIATAQFRLGSGCNGRPIGIIAGKPALKVRCPQAAARRRVVSILLPVGVFCFNDRSTPELELRRCRRANGGPRQRTFTLAAGLRRQVRDRTTASESLELALPTRRSRRCLSQRATCLLWNFADAAEQVMDGGHSQVAISELGRVATEQQHPQGAYSRSRPIVVSCGFLRATSSTFELDIRRCCREMPSAAQDNCRPPAEHAGVRAAPQRQGPSQRGQRASQAAVGAATPRMGPGRIPSCKRTRTHAARSHAGPAQ